MDRTFGRVFQRYGNWYADFRDSTGKRHRKVCPNKAEADKMVRKAQVEEFEGRFFEVNKAKPVLFSEWMAEYLDWAKSRKRSWKNDLFALQRFAKVFGDRALGTVTTWEINKWAAARAQEHRKSGSRRVKGHTVNHELAILGRFYSKAIEAGKAAANPVAKAERFKVDPLEVGGDVNRPLSRPEIEALLAAAKQGPAHLWPAMILGLHAGMRLGEVLKLKWSDVDYAGGVIHIRAETTKTEQSRTVALNPAIREALKACMTVERLTGEAHKSPFVFGSGDGPLTTIRKAFRNAQKRAGIPWCRFHDLRHTFASHLAMRGVPILTISKLLGHRSVTQTMRYAKLAPGALKDAVQDIYGADEGRGAAVAPTE